MNWLKAAAVSLAGGFLWMSFYGCGTGRETSEEKGEALAGKYCTGCHAFPSPQLLTREVWERNVLPLMGAFADIYKDKSGIYKKMPPEMVAGVRDAAIAHIRFDVPVEEWREIVTYYTKNSPAQLDFPQQSLITALPEQEVLMPRKKGKSFTGAVLYDEADQVLFQSAFRDSALYVYDNRLMLADSLLHCRGVADIVKSGNSYLLTHIGSFQPGAQPLGFVERISLKNGKINREGKLCDGLDRPVQTLEADMDGDGLADLVVCEFGFMKGQLSLFRNKGRSYEKSAILSVAGAIKAHIEDVNGDGLPDIWILLAHDTEGIYLLENQGSGKFLKKEILLFPPAYGSSGFVFANMDGDGRKDLVYTCGDNADYSQILKPYHGVYIFRNTGAGYEQVFFRHLNGCYKAMPLDINGDSLLDLAVISFFADYEKSREEGFVILKNTGNYTFTAETDTSFSGLGRWICMDIKDINRDGKPDIVLGNMAAKPGNDTELMNKWINGPEFIVLRPKQDMR